MAPADGRTQRLVAGERARTAPGQQPETVVETVQHLLHRQGPQPPRGQLQGQRDAVETAAELARGLPVGARQHEPGAHRRGAPGEELQGVVVVHRHQRVGEFAVDPQGAAPGGEDLEAGCLAEQLPYETGARVGEVLEAVDHEQEPAAPRSARPGRRAAACPCGR